MRSTNHYLSPTDVAAAVDLVLATLGVAVGVWILTAGDTLGRRAGDDRIGLAAWDLGVVLAFGGPAIILLLLAALMLRRRWALAWWAHWLAIGGVAVFGAAAFVLLA